MRYTFSVIRILFVVFVLSFTGCKGQKAPGRIIDEPPLGQVYGFVLDSLSQTPIDSAEVRLYLRADTTGSYGVMFTKNDGRYLHGAAGGFSNSALQARKAGYFTKHNIVSVAGGESLRVDFSLVKQ